MNQAPMIGVGTFEFGIGLLVAVLLVYFAFRDRRPVVMILLVIVLSLVFGVFVALAVSLIQYGLFGG